MKNLPVFDNCFIGIGVNQRIVPAGIFGNLVKPVEVERLSGDYLTLQRVVVAQHFVLALGNTGIGATLYQSN